MLCQSSAVAFVKAWGWSDSVDEAAARLSQAPAVVNRLAAELRAAGVRLRPLPDRPAQRPLPKTRTPLTPGQQKLVADYFHMVKQAKRFLRNRVIAERLGADGVESAAAEALVHSAQCFRPELGIEFAKYAQGNIRRAVFRASNAVRRLTGGPGLSSKYPQRDPRTGQGVPDPAEAAAVAEQLALVEQVLGGPLELGSSQHKENKGEVNYEDLCRLAERLGLNHRGKCRNDLLGMVADAIRDRLNGAPTVVARPEQEAGEMEFDIPVPHRTFVYVWQSAGSVAMVAAALDMTPDQVVRVANWMRQEGVKLKDVPTPSGRPANSQIQPSVN